MHYFFLFLVQIKQKIVWINQKIFVIICFFFLCFKFFCLSQEVWSEEVADRRNSFQDRTALLSLLVSLAFLG